MRADSITAASIPHAESLARENSNSKIKIPNPPAKPPARYEQDWRSIPEGAEKVYRTAGPKDHFQLRVHNEHWTVDFDQYHPKHYPVQHALVDSPGYTLAAAVALGTVFS